MTWQIPDNLDPDETCIVLPVPADRQHMRQFFGVLEELCKAWNWEYRADHAGSQLAYMWQDKIARFELLDCGMIVRTDQLCDLIAGCVDTSESVAEALQRIEVRNAVTNTTLSQVTYAGDQIARDVALAPEQKTEPVAPQPPGCDQDLIWTGIRYAVERLDEEARDFLDDLIQIQDVLERLTSLVTLIPALGAVIDSYKEFIEQWLPDVKNAYEAYSDPDNLDVFACGLFELVCDECRYPTWDELLEYLLPFVPELQAAGGKAVNMNDLGAVLTDVARVASVNPSAMWHMTVIFTLMMIEINSYQRVGFGRRTLAVWISLGTDTPNDNWKILCGGCGVPPVPNRVNFYPSAGEYTIVQGAQAPNGVEVRPTNGVNPLRAIVTVDWSNDNIDNFTRVRWYGLSNGSGDYTEIAVYDKQGNLLETRRKFPPRYVQFGFAEAFSAPIGRVEFTLAMNSNQAGSRLYYGEIF